MWPDIRQKELCLSIITCSSKGLCPIDVGYKVSLGHNLLSAGKDGKQMVLLVGMA